jgi:uncharacterized membrane protein YGL010W
MEMKTLAHQMAFYQGYHRTRGCKTTHYFGVPLVTFSILIPMGWLGVTLFGHRPTLAMAFIFFTLIYYFLLAPVLATIMTVIMVPMTLGADRVSRLPFMESVSVFAATFLAGVALQLIGHFIEGKRPALVDNFSQAVFTAPLFLVVETLMALGWKGPSENTEASG